MRRCGTVLVWVVLSCLRSLSFGQQANVSDSEIGFKLQEVSVEIAKEVCVQDSVDSDFRHSSSNKTCLIDLVEALRKMKVRDRCVDHKVDTLLLRQEISEMVKTASLQVDGFLAEVDAEASQIREVHDRLTDERDTAVGHTTWGSAIATGGGGAGSALALIQTAATVGNWLSATFGGAGTLLGFVSIRQASGPKGCFPDLRPNELRKKKDKAKTAQQCTPYPSYDDDPCGRDTNKRMSGCSPRMLYQAFFPDKEVHYHSAYDSNIKSYLANQSRKNELMAKWGISPENPAKPFLVNGNPDPQRLGITDLEERANKLADLRAIVARMNRDLSRLMEDLSKGLLCPLQESTADASLR